MPSPRDEDILTRCRQLLGEDHPYTLGSASNLAGDLRALGEYERARQLDEDALTRSRRVLGEDHPATLTSANNLARDLRALGEHERADQWRSTSPSASSILTYSPACSSSWPLISPVVERSGLDGGHRQRS